MRKQERLAKIKYEAIDRAVELDMKYCNEDDEFWEMLKGIALRRKDIRDSRLTRADLDTIEVYVEVNYGKNV